ncbi:MAG: hypothetical protein HUJ31_12880, partial [Pseudomonadales bacterium]|nr:hypothetical protein [Pseudomonadales bacterium]
MLKVALLVGETDLLIDGNYLRFANELYRHNHHVGIYLIDSLALHGSDVLANGFTLKQAVSADQAFPTLTPAALADFDVVWILSLGLRQNFLDKVQLLYTLQS